MIDVEEKTAIALRTLLLTTVGSSLTVWDIAFWLGVHGTIFYNKIFALWVTSTVVLLVALIVPKRDRFLNAWGMLALITPTLWFIINAFTPIVSLTWFELVLWILALLLFVLNIPTILFILFRLVESDVWELSPAYRNRLIVIVAIVAFLGLAVGSNHRQFITCEEFSIAGDSPPANCLQVDSID